MTIRILGFRSRLRTEFHILDQLRALTVQAVREESMDLFELVGEEDDGIEFYSVEELRLVSNSIKHNGKVSKELAKKYPRWIAGELLFNLGVTYDRLRPDVPRYLETLAAQMDRKDEE